ncbi:MAG: MFS transporter [bacterium]
MSLTPYQRRLVVFLGVACFFEGYDFIAITQILPNLRAAMELSPAQGSSLVAFINLGTILSYALVRRADRWGRRRVLTLTIAGYTLASFLSGLATGPVWFALAQLTARTFLIAEWAVSMVYAAEEFPAHRRGWVIGVIQATSSLGSTVCAGVVPALLATPLGWRSVYFVGTIPLVLLAFARRSLRESTRFASAVAVAPSTPRSLLEIMRTPYRRRILELASIWGLTYVCTQSAVTFWKEFALAERGFTDGQVGASISIAAVAAIPLTFGAGKLIDVLGRRRGGAIIFVLTSAGVFGAYTLPDRLSLTAALAVTIFGVTAVLPVLNAYTAELFPTELRGDGFAWANNLLGRIGYVLGPLLVGLAAGRLGWGASAAATAIFPLLALVFILRLMPETTGKELEETSRL